MLIKKMSLAVVMVFLLVLFTGCANTQENGEAADNPQGNVEEAGEPGENLEEEEGEEPQEAPEKAEDLEAELLALEEQFFTVFFQPETVDSTGELRDYQSKEDLLAAVSEIAVREFVAPGVDEYYMEEDNRLFIIPQGMPPKISPDLPLEVKQTAEDTCELVQDAENEMMGPYRLTVEFTRMDGRWLMSDRKLELRD